VRCKGIIVFAISYATPKEGGDEGWRMLKKGGGFEEGIKNCMGI
jgi:hypothetical protein